MENPLSTRRNQTTVRKQRRHGHREGLSDYAKPPWQNQQEIQPFAGTGLLAARIECRKISRSANSRTQQAAVGGALLKSRVRIFASGQLAANGGANRCRRQPD
ncbi:MAG: hypothetical protein L6Q55_05260 [Azonexus sp.]|nr:hypothetical protein [Azonexus sp.]MCK6411820.1 hypothetical protein [Azonexus sp.]